MDDSFETQNSEDLFDDIKKPQTGSRQDTETQLMRTVQIIHDGIGLLLSVCERLMSCEGILSKKEFKYHAFSPSRVAEGDWTMSGRKILMLVKELVLAYATLEKQNRGVRPLIELPQNFTQDAIWFLKKSASLPASSSLQKNLLKEVLNMVVDKNFNEISTVMVKEIKNAQPLMISHSFQMQDTVVQVCLEPPVGYRPLSRSYLPNSQGQLETLRKPNSSESPAGKSAFLWQDSSQSLATAIKQLLSFGETK